MNDEWLFPNTILKKGMRKSHLAVIKLHKPDQLMRDPSLKSNPLCEAYPAALFVKRFALNFATICCKITMTSYHETHLAFVNLECLFPPESQNK
jgi:hypothetical protein